MDLRGPLRHATFHDEARADLTEWIGHARALLDAAPSEETGLRARYEIVVAALRGLGDMRSADQLARDFLDTVTADDRLTDPGILEDAVILLQYGFGALLRGLTALSADDLCGWQQLLSNKIDRLLDADPPANAMAHLLAMRARLALHTDMTVDLQAVPEDLPTVPEVTASVLEAVEAGEQVPALQAGPPLTDLDTGMHTLLRLGRHLDNAPLFPIEHTADLFDYLTPVLVDHPLYREVRDLLDQATDRVTGQAARGERAQSRGHALIQGGRIPQALQEIHEAKVNWLRGDTLEGGLIMLLLCARLYSAADPGFQRTVTQLREQGWRDWHLLTAIANLVGNHRAQQQRLSPTRGDSEERRAQILAVMQAPENPDDPPLPTEAFTEHALRSHLSAAAVSTAHALGLVVRRGALDPQTYWPS
ncbi:hypothetical protein J2S54_006915 [Streptomyces sp. DSM 42143]|uniref:hypothetical protein n=1 Tax=Streptomyces sp. DSM 42143 TaxID=2817711 RepID=UPI002786019A|nr:hypothetical protein [Streptomyces sp. DSM 42143]MDQ0390095.1 hypothetical protein [Streptomyces sp. DSM 42143]